MGCFRPVLLSSSSALFIFIPKNHPVFTVVVQNDVRTAGRRIDTKSARRCAWHTRSARKKRKRNRRHVVSSSRGREGRATRRDASTKDDDDDGTHWNNNNNVIENNNQKTFYFCFVVAVVVVCAKNARSEEDGRKCDGSQKIF